MTSLFSLLVAQEMVREGLILLLAAEEQVVPISHHSKALGGIAMVQNRTTRSEHKIILM